MTTAVDFYAANGLPAVSAREFDHMRMSLRAGDEHARVNAWLLPLIADVPTRRSVGEVFADFSAIVDLVRRPVQSDQRYQTALSELEDWASQPIANEYLRLFHHVRHPGHTPSSVVIAAAFGKSLKVLASSGVDSAELLEQTKTMLQDTDATLGFLRGNLTDRGAEFLGQLITEVELLSFDNREFARDLDGSTGAFLRFGGDTSDWSQDDGRSVSLLGRKWRDAWWHLPAHVALAMAHWT
jgi:hypothetical protein